MISRTSLATALATVVCMTVTSQAKAELYTGTVAQLEYVGYGSPPYLMVQLDSNRSINYYAQQPSPGCGIASISIDTIKIWMSLLQLSMITGKSALLYTNSCGSYDYIVDVVVTS
jgi:hypothetical protein